MADFTQDNRPLSISTPLGTDKLLLERIEGREAISEPFEFELGMLAQPDYTVPFDQLLGKSVCVSLLYYLGGDTPQKCVRYFHGVVTRLSEGRLVQSALGGKSLLRYRATIVPAFALLKHRVQNRIFQNLSVPDILKKVLTGIEYTDNTQGSFKPRNYCVQYQESDFNFACRLMEEEGIFYFFKHTKDGHQLMLGNTPGAHPDLENDSTVNFSSLDHQTARDESRILYWEKFQQIRPGSYASWDHSFQMPDQSLEATDQIQSTVSVGTVSHTLSTANDSLDIFRFPGEYQKKFDGIDKGGAEQASQLSNIIPDGTRLAALRIKLEAAASMIVRGASDCRRMTPGYKFTLAQHRNGNGSYVLNHIEHHANIEGTYTSGEVVELQYENRFSSLPAGIAFVPARRTQKPLIRGTQTALVVGSSASDEIFVDKYGRVKAQFFWDRHGEKNSDSSCWMRVAQPWAGKQWGVVFLPRVGDEVVVDFLEGDPDRPIITGRVYNAEQMPPYDLPTNQTRSTIKSRSSKGGSKDNFNELRFEDKMDSEEIYIHAEKDCNTVVENNDTLKVGSDQADDGSQTIQIYNNQTITIQQGDRSVTIQTGNDSLNVSAGSSSTEAAISIELTVGSNSIKIDQSGITISGIQVQINGTAMLQAASPMTQVSGDGMLTLQGGIIMIN